MGTFKPVDLIGWLSSLVLLVTIGRQVYSQWRSGACEGVSRWLFIGQLAASTGYVVYSYLLKNWVFLTSNVAILATAVLGQFIYARNRRRADVADAKKAAA